MKKIAAIILAIILSAADLMADSIGDSVEIRILSDRGTELALHTVPSSYPAKKAYAEAVKGDHYRISVRNRLNRRVGVVIAVDGRNIVSGQKSWLRGIERMYVLEPYASYEYAGWRTGQDRINRFYFTEVADSYSASFGDQSAMGLIAVAVYPELQRYEQSQQLGGRSSESAVPAQSSGVERRKAAAPASRAEMADRSAGTGYGRTEYSPSHRVDFEPESSSVENLFIKYEWRSTLCRNGIINCGRTIARPFNRLWDSGGYAPPPGR